MNECPKDKLIYLQKKIKEIEFTNLIVNDECLNLSKEIIKMGILTNKSIDDSYYIATAIVYGCDVILSWNFKHLVNYKTINGVRAITDIKGYKGINILDPMMLLEMED